MRANFFIVGIPKAGTTAMYRYLRAHPNVFMAAPKEPSYFADDLKGLRRIEDAEEYAELFDAVSAQHYVAGDASPAYMYSQSALGRIREYNADARVLVMLRNPVDAVYALHSQLCVSAYENVRDFETAWRLQADRRRGLHLSGIVCPQMVQYQRIYAVSEQLKRLKDLFSEEQVKIVLFDDFVRSAPAIYSEILQFLRLPHDEPTAFPAHNENKRVRWRWLNSIVYRPPKSIEWAVKCFKRCTGLKRLHVIDLNRAFNHVRSSRPALSYELRRELEDAFKDEVDCLGRLLHKDLRHWLVTDRDKSRSPAPTYSSDGEPRSGTFVPHDSVTR